MSEVICLHLCSGVEIIGTICEENDESITINNTRKIMVGMDKDGYNIMMWPYATGNLNIELEFYWDDIISCYYPEDELIKEYLQQTLQLEIATSIGI